MRKNQAMPLRARHRVAVLVRDGVLPMELGLVHQVFAEAKTPGGEALYEVRTAAPVPGQVRTDADFPITVAHGPAALAWADTVIVPASHSPAETDSTGRLGPELAATLARIRPGTRIASICTGSFVLAAAGLLDGRKATTHWKSAAQFRAWFPAVDLDPNVLYVDNGDVLTSAGEASGLDLCLHLVRRDHGVAVANTAARHLVVPPHRDGGQAQFIERPVPVGPRSVTSGARDWALANLDQPLPLAELAERSAVSVRTLTRAFRAEFGLSPGQWVTRQRLEHARHLLEHSDLPVDRIAGAAGFGTATSLRAHLQASLGVSPSAYRRTFRGSEPALPA
ncbi:GlxA family transcriptional regulator [Occultella aeris]|uniref:HTH-type transcriptional regulator CdhR n=2 Tax=Occultella aeris TaxID=2761496 RepID=A0A7M4DH48_9MICO|nr:HTH-type transcriptional regulator CdhR [Occultella aeris]